MFTAEDFKIKLFFLENLFVDGILICTLFRNCKSFKKAKPILFTYLTNILNGIKYSEGLGIISVFLTVLSPTISIDTGHDYLRTFDEPVELMYSCIGLFLSSY